MTVGLSTTLPACLPGATPCAPCYLGASSQPLVFPYALTTITIEVVPIIWEFGTTATFTNYSTSTSTITVHPRSDNDTTITADTTPTFAHPTEVTWTTRGATLTWPTEYVRYYNFHGAAPTSSLDPNCAQLADLSEIDIPDNVNSSDFIFPQISGPAIPTATNGLPLALLGDLGQVPTVSQQFGGLPLSSCAPIPTSPICTSPSVSYSTITRACSDGTGYNATSSCKHSIPYTLVLSFTLPATPTSVHNSQAPGSFANTPQSHQTAAVLTTVTGSALVSRIPDDLAPFIASTTPAAQGVPAKTTSVTKKEQQLTTSASIATALPAQQPSENTRDAQSHSSSELPVSVPGGSSSHETSPTEAVPSENPTNTVHSDHTSVCQGALCVLSSSTNPPASSSVGVSAISAPEPSEDASTDVPGSRGISPAPDPTPITSHIGNAAPGQDDNVSSTGSDDGQTFPAVATGASISVAASKVDSGVYALPDSTISAGQKATLSNGQILGVDSNGNLATASSGLPVGATSIPVAIVSGPSSSFTVSKIASGVYALPETTLSAGQTATVQGSQVFSVDSSGLRIMD